MTIEEYCRWYQVEVSDDVVLAASYLQAIGYRFGIQFGVDNAVELAEAVYSYRTERDVKKRADKDRK